VEGFTDLIQAWLNEFLVQGCPDYRLNVKLKMFKEKLTEWSKANFGKLVNKRIVYLKNWLKLMSYKEQEI